MSRSLPARSLAAGFAFFLIAAGCGHQSPLLAAEGGRCSIYSESRFALGPVMVSVQAVAPDEASARRAIDRAFEAIKQVNDRMSAHLATSEIYRLNRDAGLECPVSDDTAFVLRKSIEFSELTGGTFDVTAGPLITIWKKMIADVTSFREAVAALGDADGFFGPVPAAIDRVIGQAIEVRLLPDPARVAAARKLVGYRRLSVGAKTARLAEPAMSVDLGGIAKGYAVDRAVAALKAEGIRNALVDAGGDGYALGTRPDGTPWRIGIRNPRAEEDERLDDVLLLSNRGYATSGDYEQYVDVNGVRYAHIVDPRTGQPARSACSATVVAEDGITANALTKAPVILGPDDGIRLIEKLPNVECMVIAATATGLEIKTTPGFRKLAVHRPPAAAK